MKRILLALSFGWLVTACVDQSVNQPVNVAPSPEASVVDQAAPSSRLETDETVVAPRDLTDCLNACDDRYADCMGNAQDSFAECQCFNGDVGCRRGCGIHGTFHQC
jgi:hypothetical protein